MKDSRIVRLAKVVQRLAKTASDADARKVARLIAQIAADKRPA